MAQYETCDIKLVFQEQAIDKKTKKLAQTLADFYEADGVQTDDHSILFSHIPARRQEFCSLFLKLRFPDCIIETISHDAVAGAA